MSHARCWLVPLLLLGACGGSSRSSCELAADKLASCDFGSVVASQGYARLPLTISTDDCSGTNACLAACVNDASCEAIVYTALGSSTDPNTSPPAGGGAFYGCVIRCIQK